MIECTNCKASNPDGSAYCYKCGHVFQAKPETRQFNEQDDTPVIPKRRWGTARFDSQTFVQFYVRGYDEPVRVVFAKEELLIGRTHGDVKVDIDLSAHGGLEAGVSRKHAALRRQNDTIVLVDLGSSNHTYLNGQRIIPNEPRILRDGDEMRLGRLVIRTTFEDMPIMPDQTNE